MRVYELADPESMAARSHPWTGSAADPEHRYRDFRTEPALIRSSLEDFGPWEGHPAVETHYQLLEWLNGPDSRFESNDCAFSGPSENEVEGIPMRLQCSGRLMILFRHLPTNTDDAQMHVLKNTFGQALSLIDTDFEWGAVGATTVPVRFRGLPVPHQHGQQLMISFWAWGDDVEQTMAHLNRTLQNVSNVLRRGMLHQ